MQAMLRHSTSSLHADLTMPHKTISSPSPKKHNFLSFKDKLELIRKCEAGIARCVIAAQMGVPSSTVSTIWKNRDKYCEIAASTTFLHVFLFPKNVLYSTLIVKARGR
ncbi:hypothetical protein E2C01_078467 [Portunus trituberculatus]|uniref:HTH psq-type domain-containing protein n=1 Tax=Portunus trituberculatus TaxID=210409 RepID=A0A5B7IED5_PORTR|nr:hypothetical protein [Portunus trituberculatus]